jgi:CBS domain-containing protein
MADKGLTRFPVVDRESGRLVGMIALTDLLKARARNLDAEHRRERVLGARLVSAVGARDLRAGRRRDTARISDLSAAFTTAHVLREGWRTG